MIFIAFIPWLIFWVFLGLHEPKSAALAACLGMLVVNGINLLKGKGLKLLQISTFFYFILLVVLVFFIDLNRYWIWVRISSSLFLASVVFFSIVFKKPFTLQFAREKVNKEILNDPEFIKVNYVISGVWCGAFFLQLVIPATRIFGFHPPKMLGPAFSILVFFAALIFCKRYAKYKRPLGKDIQEIT
jgi:hypothetical protein